MAKEVVLSPVERAECVRACASFSCMESVEGAFNGLVSVCVGLANRQGYVGETLKEIPEDEKYEIVYAVLLTVCRYGNGNLLSMVKNPVTFLMKKFDDFAELC